MSGIDRQLRLRSNRTVSEESYLEYVCDQVVDWTPAEIEQLTAVLGGIRKKLEPIKKAWPERIRLIKTTGREENGAAYCREATIVLPQSVLKRDAKALERLLLHELFHIISNHTPELRNQLYQVVGFTACAEIALPDELKSRKITNPDAPAINCIMKLSNGDHPIVVTPVLLSRRASYENIESRSLFSELLFRLMVVQQKDGIWQAALTDDGRARLLDPTSQRSFREQIGRNTKYVVHPEEILADNFVHLVLKSTDLPDMWIIDEMRKQLER